jgi:hypothetical protein
MRNGGRTEGKTTYSRESGGQLHNCPRPSLKSVLRGKTMLYGEREMKEEPICLLADQVRACWYERDPYTREEAQKELDRLTQELFRNN